MADGCGSGQHSEVGAHIFSRIITTKLCETGWAIRGITTDSVEDAWREFDVQLELMRQNTLVILRELMFNMAVPGRRSSTVEHYLLFTVVGAIITPKWTCVFYLGDGTFSVNGQLTCIKPDGDGNAPTYLAYAAGNSSINRNLLSFQIGWFGPTEKINSIILGTDGLQDLQRQQSDMTPDGKSFIGGIDQFLQDNFFTNADAIRRRLTLINRPVERPDWDGRRVVRIPGKLPDDTTMVVIRRNRPVVADAPAPVEEVRPPADLIAGDK